MTQHHITAFAAAVPNVFYAASLLVFFPLSTSRPPPGAQHFPSTRARPFVFVVCAARSIERPFWRQGGGAAAAARPFLGGHARQHPLPRLFLRRACSSSLRARVPSLRLSSARRVIPHVCARCESRRHRDICLSRTTTTPATPVSLFPCGFPPSTTHKHVEQHWHLHNTVRICGYGI